MFQVLFGDDEHTAAEGPYVRMLKARKWLLLSSGLATLHAYRLIDLAKLQKALGDIAKIPSWMLTLALTTGLAYLLVQAVLITIQLRETYEQALAARLPDSPAINDARARLREIHREVLALHRMPQEGDIDRRNVSRQLEELEREDEGLSEEIRRERIVSLRQNLGFMLAEVAIDWLRLGPPILVACYALGHLFLVHPGYFEPKRPAIIKVQAVHHATSPHPGVAGSKSSASIDQAVSNPPLQKKSE